MKELTGTLENWMVDKRFLNQGGYIIWGNLLNDAKERWAEGTRIHTSKIKTKDFPIESLKEGDVVKTVYSLYKLGKPANATVA